MTDLHDALRPLIRNLPLGIAVSGGGDSLALLHLAADLAGPHGVHAVTVDHGLRPDSASEAAFVARICAARGISHDVLRWNGPTTTGNLMEQARLARLRLIGGWAVGRGLTQVALGHTADDQAEGFLMGLQRKAGLAGLIGMRRQFHAEGILWRRPLLDIPRLRLRQWLTEHGHGWIDDPSNENDRFTRARSRKALRLLTAQGIGPDQIAASMAHLAGAEAELNAHLRRFVADCVTECAGTLRLARQDFDSPPPELLRRFLRAAVLWIGGADHPPRGPALARFLASAQDGRAATLAGTRLRSGPRHLLLSREPRAIRQDASPIWDGRWHLSGPCHGELRPLGAEGLRQRPHWRDSGLPRDGLVASPALWDGARLISAPLLDSGETTATIRPSFTEFLISH